MAFLLILFCYNSLIIYFFKTPYKPISSTKKKTNQEAIDKYQPLALDIINQNSSIMNVERKRHKRIKIFMIFCTVAAVGLFTFSSFNRFFAVVAIILVLVFLYLRTKNTKQVLFEIIFPTLLKTYNNEIQYSHQMGISSNLYAEARFEHYNRFSIEDYIIGKICGCDYQISDILTEREHVVEAGNRSYTPIFSGTFAKVTLNKNFNSTICIVNNKIKLLNRDDYITIDNEEFEKRFDVFTNDKILAMRLLTPDVTTKMIDIYNQTGIYFGIKIIKNFMYIRLYTSCVPELTFSNPNKESIELASSIATLDSIYIITNSFIEEIERIDI